MNQNNQSLVKHLVESPELRKWARKTIVTKGGKKNDALTTHLRAAYLLWERLDMGMEIQQPEAYVRTVMIKTWKDMDNQGQSDDKNVLDNDNPMPIFISDSYGNEAQTVVMKRTQMKEEKITKILSWNDVIVKRERRRRQMIIVSVIVLTSALAGAAYWFFIMANG